MFQCKKSNKINVCNNLQHLLNVRFKWFDGKFAKTYYRVELNYKFKLNVLDKLRNKNNNSIWKLIWSFGHFELFEM